VTNDEIRHDVADAMRFLRTCGSDGGPRQADAIQRLLSRMSKQDEALHRLKVTLDEVVGDIPPIEPRCVDPRIAHHPEMLKHPKR